uniref:Ras association domain family member 11 n=1 Tax=Takifugu rubripes TaxID=31033 RepID=A0A674PDL2_TAKRU
MEVKVFVDGVSRVVCGVTEETTCQDVVIALAQALGQPGRYTLRETFKDFERCMSPGERLLETLEKYGEQAKEVRLTLHHNGPSDAGARMRRGSGTLTLHRQSLPPFSLILCFVICWAFIYDETTVSSSLPAKKDLRQVKCSLFHQFWYTCRTITGLTSCHIIYCTTTLLLCLSIPSAQAT